MPQYTAILFTNPDGSHTARVPALPGCTAEGRTRAEALENARRAAAERLAAMAAAGERPPREEWAPARTVWVQNPRTGDAIPYVVAIERTEEGLFSATAVLFPELREAAKRIEESLARLRPRIYEHLVGLVAQGRPFPVQDDPQAYVITVPGGTQSPGGSGPAAPAGGSARA